MHDLEMTSINRQLLENWLIKYLLIIPNLITKRSTPTTARWLFHESRNMAFRTILKRKLHFSSLCVVRAHLVKLQDVFFFLAK